MNEPPDDPYWKLRPESATPDDEVCHCPPGSAVVLRYEFSRNPLYCVSCNGEVPPERIGFGPELGEAVAVWRMVMESLYYLWLDSGEYEEWAAARLLDPEGKVNRTGRAVVADLNGHVPAYYWWFQDVGIDDYQLPGLPGSPRTLRRPQFSGL